MKKGLKYLFLIVIIIELLLITACGSENEKEVTQVKEEVSQTIPYMVSAKIVEGNLIIYMSDGSIINAGYVKGDEGERGAQGETGVQGEKGKDGKDGQNGKKWY